jgi:hypothetical protein
MLRAVRYLSTLPGFQLDPATAEAITARVERISDVAPERIQTEWKHLLDGERWITGVEMARRFGLAARSFSVVEDMAVAMAWSKYGDETGLSTTCGVQALSVRLAAVLSGDVRTLGRKPVGNALLSLKWPTRLVRQALHIAEWACRAPGTDERELVEWVLADAAAAAAAAALAQAWFHAREDQVPLGVSNLRVLAQRAAEPRWVTGGDLRSWGMNEGRELGGVLAEAGRGQLLRRWDGAQPAREWARGRAALIGRTAAGGAPPRTPERDR